MLKYTKFTAKPYVKDSVLQLCKIVRLHQQTNTVSELVWIQCLPTDVDRLFYKVTQHCLSHTVLCLMLFCLYTVLMHEGRNVICTLEMQQFNNILPYRDTLSQ